MKDLTAAAAARFGDDIALEVDGRSFTFTQLEYRIARVATVLREAGLPENARVAILAGNSLTWFDGTLATIRLRVARSYVNERLSAVEIGRVLKRLDPHLVLVAPHLVTLLEPSCLTMPVLVADADYEDRVLRANPTPPPIEDRLQRVDFIRFTSGTTGEPKGVMHTPLARSVWASIVVAETGMSYHEGVLHSSSLNFAGWAQLFPALHVGARQYVMRKFDPAAAVDLIAEKRIAHSVMVPTMVADLVSEAERRSGTADLSSLRSIMYGGAPISSQLLKRALAALGPVLIGSYGLSEFNAATILRREEHRPGSPRLSSVGCAHLLADVRVVGGNGEALAGQTGEVQLSGPQVTIGYWDDPKRTSELFTEDGWLHTNDVGYLDEEGYLYIVDRKTDMIVSGGFNIYPAEVEAVLSNLKEVAEVAVVSLVDERLGERIHAVVRLADSAGIDDRRLDEWCRQHLAGYKVPRSYTLVRDELPKTASGKVMRRAVRDMARQMQPGSQRAPKRPVA